MRLPLANPHEESRQIGEDYRFDKRFIRSAVYLQNTMQYRNNKINEVLNLDSTSSTKPQYLCGTTNF